ncbi:MAG: HAMP domain-containing histidine kinase [Eubacterium sp.]|nr:HAMP domain-containing histidine kinase [Eubacterium sp.]
MKIRNLIIYMIIFAVLGILMCVYIARGSKQDAPAYPTEINRLVISLGKNWDDVKSKKEQKIISEEPFEYAVIDPEGNLLCYTKEGIATSVSTATTQFDVIRDIEQDGRIVGRLLVHNPYLELQQKRDIRQALMIGTLFLAMLLITVGYFIYLRNRVVKPFDRLKGFAARVAGGDLDTPLEMDRAHVFGAFTESFDIMREELKISREREAEAVRSRKELVAELSHDIKTPVASIKAMADVMSLTAKDDMERETIAAINGKADQIDHLISNLFHATLEELEQLEVKPEEISSTEILQMIRDADYRKMVLQPELKDAVVLADRLRINQVISNIIANSYKYANTQIRINSAYEGSGPQYLMIEISDRGGGVPEEELELVTGKFKRGSNTKGKDGSGLGLYISKYFMEKMEGSLECFNRDGGFAVRLKLPVA